MCELFLFYSLVLFFSRNGNLYQFTNLHYFYSRQSGNYHILYGIDRRNHNELHCVHVNTIWGFLLKHLRWLLAPLCAAAFASLLLERISMIRRSFSSTATFIPRHPIALRNCDRSKLYALPFTERASSGVMSELSSNAAACLAHFSTRRLALLGSFF